MNRGIQALSAELLSEIFLIATHSFEDKDKKRSVKISGPVEADNTVFPQPLLSKEPCTLTRVCKFWRRVALSNPFLWSHIRICGGYGLRRTLRIEKCIQSHLRMVSTWLKLSRNVPLMICLDEHSRLSSSLPDELICNIGRLKVLHVIQDRHTTDTNWDIGSPMVEMLMGRAMSLGRLHIYYRARNFTDGYNTKFYLTGLPRLKHLCHPFALTIVVNTHDYPRSLESLEGQWIHRECLRNLKYFPRLQVLHASLRSDIYSWVLFRRFEETVSQLTKLELESTPKELKTFLDYLVLPVVKIAVFKIQDLESEIMYGEEHYLTNFLPSFLMKTFSTLTELHLPEASIGEMDGIKLLKNSPLLQRITLGTRILTDEGLIALELRGGSLDTDICPSLVMLRLQSMIDTNISAGQVLRTIHSRLERKPELVVYLELRYKSDQVDAIRLDTNSSLQELMQQSVLDLTLYFPSHKTRL